MADFNGDGSVGTDDFGQAQAPYDNITKLYDWQSDIICRTPPFIWQG